MSTSVSCGNDWLVRTKHPPQLTFVVSPQISLPEFNSVARNSAAKGTLISRVRWARACFTLSPPFQSVAIRSFRHLMIYRVAPLCACSNHFCSDYQTAQLAVQASRCHEQLAVGVRGKCPVPFLSARKAFSNVGAGGSRRPHRSRGRLEAGVDESWAFQQALCRRAPGCSESRTEMVFGS